MLRCKKDCRVDGTDTTRISIAVTALNQQVDMLLESVTIAFSRDTDPISIDIRRNYARMLPSGQRMAEKASCQDKSFQRQLQPAKQTERNDIV